MESQDREALVSARHAGWGALRNRVTDEWPKWVKKLDDELDVWLHGERVDHAAFSYVASEDGWVENALEATELTVTVLSGRFVWQAKFVKSANSVAASRKSVAIVPRRAITALEYVPQSPMSGQGPAFITRATFEGIDEQIQIPVDADEWYLVEMADRMRIFAGLRDDLIAGDPPE